MRHFWVFRARARQSWSPSSAAGVARDGKDGENALTEASGCIIDGGQEAKMEILAYGTTMQTQGQIPLRKFGKTDARASRPSSGRGERRADRGGNRPSRGGRRRNLLRLLLGVQPRQVGRLAG